MPTNALQGRCHCGKIRFSIQPPTRMFSHCHCESCRRTHGSAFVSWTSAPRSQFTLVQGEDQVAHYESSPGMDWQFCRHCGSPLFQTTHHTPDIIYVVVAALDSSPDRPAEGHFSYEERVPWLEIRDDLPKFKGKTSDLIRSSDRK